MIRIAKFIAQCGHCSRREAESLIEQGRVAVNGVIITTPVTFITDHSVKIDGKLINNKNTRERLWLFYKPKAIITTNKDEENRKTIFDLLPKNLPRVIAVGRLDYNTEGLLLLTTSGRLSRFLELPKNKFVRKYRVRVFGKVNHERLKKLENGITIDGVRYGSIKAEVDSQKESNSWITIEICEGKNREVRKIMEELGLQVSRLIRISFGDFELGNMKPCEIVEVPQEKLKKLELTNESDKS